jgi:hypothetical protein
VRDGGHGDVGGAQERLPRAVANTASLLCGRDARDQRTLTRRLVSTASSPALVLTQPKTS